MALKLQLRRIIHATLRHFLRLRAEDYTCTGSVSLVLAPHADDEVFGCGGLIAQKRQNNHAVHIVYITDSSGSHPGHPILTSERTKEIRAEEARVALQLLGVDSTTVHRLNAKDGSLHTLKPNQAAQLADGLRQLIEEIKPDEIYVPYRRDGSSEHEATFRLLREVQAKLICRPRIYEFLIWAWWSPSLLCRAILASPAVIRCDIRPQQSLKRKAVAVYRSQIAAIPPWTRAVLPEGFVDFFDSHEEYFFQGESF